MTELSHVQAEWTSVAKDKHFSLCDVQLMTAQEWEKKARATRKEPITEIAEHPHQCGWCRL